MCAGGQEPNLACACWYTVEPGECLSNVSGGAGEVAQCASGETAVKEIFRQARAQSRLLGILRDQLLAHSRRLCTELERFRTSVEPAQDNRDVVPGVRRGVAIRSNSGVIFRQLFVDSEPPCGTPLRLQSGFRDR